jgi:signal transduction histidine kinase
MAAWRPVLPALLAAAGLVLLLFLVYELAERLWLASAEPELIRMLHRVRGVAASLLAAGVASWLILKRVPPLLAEAPAAVPDAGAHAAPQHTAAQRLHYARWFIMMRWVAVVVAAVAVFVTIEVAEFLPRRVGPPLGATIVLLALLNVGYAVHLRWLGATATFLALQAYIDVLVLILLLHFSGGVENPLAPLLLLHVIIAGIVLGRTHAYLVAGAASALFALMALGEATHVLAHYTLKVFPHFHADGVLAHAAHDPLYVSSRIVLQTAVLFLVAFFTSTLRERIRQDEHQLAAAAERALRQARELEAAVDTTVRAERLAAVGELAGQVAHEVNNPIAVISAKAKLLLRAGRVELPERTAAEIAKIGELADRVAGIAQGLLSYGRPAAGRRGPQDVRLPVRRALACVEARAASQDVRVVDLLPGELPAVQANANELEQVFLNLFINALDAMPAGGTLTIRAASARAGARAGGTLTLDVIDTGSGIDPAIRPRVFEPFMTTKQGHGSGLGLSICQGLIRSHGGEIALTDAPGGGTVVSVSLPAPAGPPVRSGFSADAAGTGGVHV